MYKDSSWQEEKDSLFCHGIRNSFSKLGSGWEQGSISLFLKGEKRSGGALGGAADDSIPLAPQ